MSEKLAEKFNIGKRKEGYYNIIRKAGGDSQGGRFSFLVPRLSCRHRKVTAAFPAISEGPGLKQSVVSSRRVQIFVYLFKSLFCVENFTLNLFTSHILMFIHVLNFPFSESPSQSNAIWLVGANRGDKCQHLRKVTTNVKSGPIDANAFKISFAQLSNALVYLLLGSRTTASIFSRLR